MKEMSPPYLCSRKCGLALLALSVLIGIGCALIAPAIAHPPSALALEYDTERQTLLVAVTHTVDDPSNHYVTRLELSRNGAPYLTKDYYSQPAKSEFTYTLAVEAVSGDELGVIAYCNRYGTFQKELTVSVPAGPLTSAPSATPAANATPEAPGFDLLVALASAGTVYWLLRR